MMRFFLPCILVVLPFTAWAGPSYADTTDLSDSPVAVDPDLPGDVEHTEDHPDDSGPFWQYGNPYSPASATNFELLTISYSFRQNRLNGNTYEPDWLHDPFGRYGSPYSPDPLNQRYDVGNLYSPGGPMHLYSRGGRMERR
jgi:hypothetical protein